MSVYPPFFKERHRITVDGIKPQHPIRGPYLRKLRTKITLPEILILGNVWRGASEIVKIFRLSYTNGLSLLNIVPSSNANYCACVAWRVGTEVFRYKLWKDVGEILYAPDYSGQCVGTSFDIEIWNTNNATLHGGGDIIYLSQLILPSSYCDDADNSVELDLNLHNCVDVTFELTNYEPIKGDYYVVTEINSCRVASLIKAVAVGYLTIQCPDDLTWHKFYLVRLQDPVSLDYFTDSFIDPNPSAAGILPYYPMKTPSGTSYKLQCSLIDGDYYQNLNEVSPTEGSLISLLTTPQDGLSYTMRLTDDLLLQIAQTGS